MSTSTPARDFLLPGLNALIEAAAGQGIGRDVAVAVLIDLITGPGFNDTPLDPAEDAPPHDTGSVPIEVNEAARAYANAIPGEGGGHGSLRRRVSPITLP